MKGFENADEVEAKKALPEITKKIYEMWESRMNKLTFVCVVGVIHYKDKYLLLKRTSERNSQPNKWQPV